MEDLASGKIKLKAQDALLGCRRQNSLSLDPDLGSLPTMQDFEKAITLAQVAERAERYNEMTDFMCERVSKGGPLSAEERDLLSAAFKGALNGRRHAVRVAKSVEQAETGQKAELASGYRSKVESEMDEICEKAVSLLKSKLIPSADAGEAKAFYLKMQGDYHRYTAEFAKGGKRVEAVEAAKAAYERGTEEATQSLHTTHPVRLGLALNFSVFLHEVLHDVFVAINIAMNALEKAQQDIENAPPEARQDSELTMRLLKDNLSIWAPQA